MVVAVAQGKTLGVGPGIGAEVTDLCDAVHGQCRIIGPKDALIGVKHDDSVRQPGDDLLQLAAIGFGTRDVLAHWGSTRVMTL
ncbi:hypothetical protein D3C84_890900 [compost metagenome]